MNVVLTLRRIRRDFAILCVWIALVAFAVVLAVGQPRLLLETVDAGARQAVVAAGSTSDLLVGATVGSGDRGGPTPISAARIEAVAEAVPGRLPAALRSVYRDSSLTVLGPATSAVGINGVAPTGVHPLQVRVALLTAQNRDALRLASGALPADVAAPSTIDVVLSAASASASGLRPGDEVEVASVPVSSAITGSSHLTLRVVGIIDERSGLSADSAPWQDTAGLWKPTVPKGASSSDPVQITVLTDEGGIATAAARYSSATRALLRVRVAPSKFTAARAQGVESELLALSASTSRLGGSSAHQLSFNSQLGDALDSFADRERATVAQVSIVVAGVLGVTAAVLVLVSSLLARRREAEIALERARGASLRVIALRSLVESAVELAVGAGIGFAIVEVALPGPFVQPAVLILVMLVALAAVPVQTILAVYGLWAGRRTPANLRDRLELVRRARARRIAVEATLLVVAVAAFASLIGRGLLETQTSGIDPLLAAAPLLLAVAVTVIVLRLYRYPVQLAASFGRRSVGALGLLAAVRAQRSIAILPLGALTLAVALAVGGGLLADTVAAGQVTASWQRVGADVRATGSMDAGTAAQVARSRGVTAATALLVRDGVQLRLPSGTDFATLVGIDSSFPAVVASLPAGGTGDVASLRSLVDAPASSTELPVVVDPTVAQELGGTSIGLYIGITFVTGHVIGVTSESPQGYLTGPFVYVDRAALARILHRSVDPTVLLANGPGAPAAVAATLPSARIVTRSGWLEARRHLALVSGVSSTISFSFVALAILGVIALVVTVLGGARERGRSLALVRTIGLPARSAWWLALAELAPTLIAALSGGVAAGVGMVLLLEPAIGIGVLAGGTGEPQPVILAGTILGLVAAAILLLAGVVLVEGAIRRGDRLNEVVRVGETV